MDAEQNDDNLKKDMHGGLPYARRRMWKSEKDLSFPLNSNELYCEVDFSKNEAKTKHLFPLIENSGLGYDFALARGFCDISLGLSDPRGAFAFLFAKANEDCNGIKEIVAKRVEERSELIKNYSAYHATSFSVGGLKN